MAFLRGNPNISVRLEFIQVEPFVRPKKSLTDESIERVDKRCGQNQLNRCGAGQSPACHYQRLP
ncbi:hypothetical protein [Nostoc sp. PA-18-2419]|uniref:hypothetical protein n=1 Tax=Nostoc sp. PA-18-2419 TaxID=2575443 RepID=UPI001108D6A1|nr:hypothetical protein [Nostoc sp. PA-18-2419]